MITLEYQQKHPNIRISVGTRQQCDSCGSFEETVTYFSIANLPHTYLCWDCEASLLMRLRENVDYHERCKTFRADSV